MGSLLGRGWLHLIFFFVCVSVLLYQTMSVQGACVTSGEKGIFPISISAFNLAVQGAGSQPGK